uniref:Uncharacterized protein n=1 Tax=Strigamia maritima TaxID=126957 RepID=T1JL36_STRMM
MAGEIKVAMETGDSTVGKTALLQMFTSDGVNFPKNYTMTCGVELCVKSVNIPETDDSVELYLYDSGGKDSFTESLKQYWSKPCLLCLVYDVTNENSLQNVKKWYDMVKTLCEEEHLPAVLIGNKIDLKERRQVSPKAAQEIAKSLEVVYLECSVKENKNVPDPFFYLANEWHKMYLEKTTGFKTIT